MKMMIAGATMKRMAMITVGNITEGPMAFITSRSSLMSLS